MWCRTLKDEFCVNWHEAQKIHYNSYSVGVPNFRVEMAVEIAEKRIRNANKKAYKKDAASL